jgi:hypothetical protein
MMGAVAAIGKILEKLGTHMQSDTPLRVPTMDELPAAYGPFGAHLQTFSIPPATIPQMLFRDEAPLIRDFFGHPKKMELFERLLRARGQERLLQRYRASLREGGSLPESCREQIDILLWEYYRRTRLANEVRSGLAEPELALIAGATPSLGPMIERLGRGRSLEMIRAHMEVIFMAASFVNVEHIVQGYRALHRRGGTHKSGDAKDGPLSRMCRALEQTISGDPHLDRFLLQQK